MIQNMMQDVSTRRSLSTAEHKVRSNQEVIGFIKEKWWHQMKWCNVQKKIEGPTDSMHKHAVVRRDVNNGIALHVAKNERRFDWRNMRVVRSVREYWESRATEAIISDPARTQWTWTTDYTSQLPGTHLGPNLEISNNACFQISFNRVLFILEHYS